MSAQQISCLCNDDGFQIISVRGCSITSNVNVHHGHYRLIGITRENGRMKLNIIYSLVLTRLKITNKNLFDLLPGCMFFSSNTSMSQSVYQ